MSVQTVCLGWHWMPYRYSRTADDIDGAPVKPFPGWLAELGRRALADVYADPGQTASYAPDVALINYYDGNARMGMHADKDERSPAPVVSLSLAACASGRAFAGGMLVRCPREMRSGEYPASLTLRSQAAR